MKLETLFEDIDDDDDDDKKNDNKTVDDDDEHHHHHHLLLQAVVLCDMKHTKRHKCLQRYRPKGLMCDDVEYGAAYFKSNTRPPMIRRPRRHQIVEAVDHSVANSHNDDEDDDIAVDTTTTTMHGAAW